jgi:hypothetical protein
MMIDYSVKVLNRVLFIKLKRLQIEFIRQTGGFYRQSDALLSYKDYEHEKILLLHCNFQ